MHQHVQRPKLERGSSGDAFGEIKCHIICFQKHDGEEGTYALYRVDVILAKTSPPDSNQAKIMQN
jgi:hypothetical protein